MDQDPAQLPPPRRSPVLRLLAPLALVLSVVVLIAVFSSSLGDGDSDPQRGGGGGGGANRGQNQSGGGGQNERPPKRYEVEEGDSLSAIAERFDVPVERLIELNPDIDPQALSTGEKLKLR